MPSTFYCSPGALGAIFDSCEYRGPACLSIAADVYRAGVSRSASAQQWGSLEQADAGEAQMAAVSVAIDRVQDGECEAGQILGGGDAVEQHGLVIRQGTRENPPPADRRSRPGKAWSQTSTTLAGQGL